VVIHPDDAAPLHITPGDEVRVSNARGAFFRRRGCQRSRQARRGRQYERPVAGLLKGWRDDQRNRLMSGTRIWAAARSFTTTACALKNFLIE